MCRRAIFTLSLDRCSYPNDSVRVYISLMSVLRISSSRVWFLLKYGLLLFDIIRVSVSAGCIVLIQRRRRVVHVHVVHMHVVLPFSM